MLRTLLNKFGYSWLLIGVVISFLATSCVTNKKALRIEEVNQPLRVIRKAVEYAMVSAIKKKSRNGRIYYSKYHAPGKDLGKRPTGNLKRAQLIIGILGGRPPYTIEVAYRIEKYDSGKYRISEYDKKMAQEYKIMVEEYLASRPDGVDLIDGFRPY